MVSEDLQNTANLLRSYCDKKARLDPVICGNLAAILETAARDVRALEAQSLRDRFGVIQGGKAAKPAAYSTSDFPGGDAA